MIEGIPLTALLTPVGVTGLLIFIFYMVATGKAGTPAQLKSKDEEILWLRQTNKEQRDQIDILITQQSNVIQLMSALRVLAEKRGLEE